ncbi:thermostable alkaline protease precursor [Apiospora marii]|uniref:thermostable alkaline protease precursor n=1 Tax=Apiospora marii TaxID=335849 RepID=UPI00312CD578
MYKQAIKWAAGGKQMADIISMSFGFPRADIEIENAIEDAMKSRGKSIIILASAGNSASEVECFPARLDSVMSIHATDPYGYFLKSSSIYHEDGPVALGTYGDGLPKEFLSELHAKHPNVVQPGSSVATAVAAGISATILSYVDALPALCSFQTTERDKIKIQRVRESRGMEDLFKHMKARRTGRQLWVDPISFWRDCGSHDARYRAILGCMENFDRFR